MIIAEKRDVLVIEVKGLLPFGEEDIPAVGILIYRLGCFQLQSVGYIVFVICICLFFYLPN